MFYDHIMMLSEEEINNTNGNTVENTGYLPLFEQYPPNKVLLFNAGPSAEYPALIQSTAAKDSGGEVYFPEVTEINNLPYDNGEQISGLAFTIYSEFFDGIKEFLPDQFTEKPNNRIIITLSSGSSLHSSLLMSVGMEFNAIFTTIRRIESENKAIVQSHDWITEGFSTNLGKTGQMKDVLARNTLRAMLIFRSENSLLTDHIFSGEMTHEETTNICSSDGVLPDPVGFSTTVTRLQKEGLVEIMGEQKSVISQEIKQLNDGISDSEKELNNKKLEFRNKKLELQNTYGFDFDLDDTDEDDVGKKVKLKEIKQLNDEISDSEEELKSLKKEKKELLHQRYTDTKYRLTSKGWMVALRQLREALDDDSENREKAPLEGISKERNPDLVNRYMMNKDPFQGIILGVRAFKPLNTTFPMAAIGVANSLLSEIDSVISLFIRNREELTPSLNFDHDFSKEENPLNSIWREEDGDKFEKYYKEWFEYLDKREIAFTSHWALFDAPSDQMEESFRLFCEWLWPRISAEIRGGVPDWKCDITQLGREQQLCAILFSTMYNLPLTWTKVRRGREGVRREVPLSTLPTSSHIIHLPIGLLSQIIPTSNDDIKLKIDKKVLVGLLIHKKEIKEAEEEALIFRKNNPTKRPGDSKPELPITLNDLNDKVKLWVDSGKVPNKFQLTTGDGNVNPRVVKKLESDGLILLKDVQQHGGGNALQLTFLGELLAKSIYEKNQGR